MDRLPPRLDVSVIEATCKEIREALDEEYEWLLEEAGCIQATLLETIDQPDQAKSLKQLSRKLEVEGR
jgi:hypothetical protein